MEVEKERKKPKKKNIKIYLLCENLAKKNQERERKRDIVEEN